MRIAGTIIPTEKKLHISLRYIFGIGPKRAMDVCAETKISPDKRVKDLTPEEEALLISAMQQYVLETDLRREISSDIKRLQDIGSYRGYRHRRKLPVRGQKTKTNARTRKGRGAAVANKKVVTK